MIVHLHSYNEEHRGCPYCSIQKLKRVRNENSDLESDFLRIIDGGLNEIIDKISTHLNSLSVGNLLLTNIATSHLRPLGSIMDALQQNREDITIVESFLFKNEEVSFARRDNHEMTLDAKRAIVQIDQCKLEEINIREFNHYIFIDDVYDSGDSYQIAKEKLIELGILERDISLITILNIRN